MADLRAGMDSSLGGSGGGPGPSRKEARSRGFLQALDLGGRAPSKYKADMQGDVAATLAAALCPESLFDDHYAKFIDERTTLLLKDEQTRIG